MGMADCVKCLDTPCGCGWGYRTYSRDARIQLAAKILGLEISVANGKLRRVTPKEHPLLEQERRECAQALKAEHPPKGEIHGDRHP